MKKEHTKCGIYKIIEFEKGEWLYNDVKESLFQIFRCGNGVLIIFKSHYQIGRQQIDWRIHGLNNTITGK